VPDLAPACPKDAPRQGRSMYEIAFSCEASAIMVDDRGNVSRGVTVGEDRSGRAEGRYDGQDMSKPYCRTCAPVQHCRRARLVSLFVLCEMVCYVH
jgi:hypothetical protein